MKLFTVEVQPGEHSGVPKTRALQGSAREGRMRHQFLQRAAGSGSGAELEKFSVLHRGDPLHLKHDFPQKDDRDIPKAAHIL